MNTPVSVPFKKKSSTWKAIETLKVFQTLPQNPHFHQLSEFAEEYREETALSLMFCFAFLVGKIGSLKLEDPRSTYDSSLKTLGELEMNGFDIARVKDCVKKLLSVKDMVNESTEAGNEASKLNAVTGSQKKIMELKKEFAAVISEVQSFVE